MSVSLLQRVSLDDSLEQSNWKEHLAIFQWKESPQRLPANLKERKTIFTEL